MLDVMTWQAMKAAVCLCQNLINFEALISFKPMQMGITGKVVNDHNQICILCATISICQARHGHWCHSDKTMCVTDGFLVQAVSH